MPRLTLSTPAAPAAPRRLLPGRRAAPAVRPLVARRSRGDLSRRWALLVLAAAVLGGLALRLLVDRSIWLDEAISIRQAGLGLVPMLEDIQLTDRHPPLHHLVLWGTVRLLGDSELAVRLPSILAGAAAIPAAYLLGRELYDRRCGVVAAALVALSPLLVWYAQEARMYAFVALLVLLSSWAQIRALRTGGWRWWALYAVAGAALMWSHYATVLLLGAQQIAFAGAALRRRRGGRSLRPQVWGWAAATAFLAWQAVPLALFAARQFESTGADAGFSGQSQFSGEGADSVGFYTVVANGAWALWGYHPDGVTELLSAAWPLFLLFALLLLGRGRSWRTGFLLLLVLVPVLGMFAAGLANRDLFEVRYFLAAVPVLLVLLARGLTSWAPRGSVRVAAIGLTLTAFALGLADQQLNPDNPRRYDNRSALQRVAAMAGPRDLVLHEPPDLRFVLRYYAPQLRARPLAQGTPSRREARRVFVVGSFLDLERFRDRTNALVGRLRFERRQVAAFDEAQVRVWVFE